MSKVGAVISYRKENQHIRLTNLRGSKPIPFVIEHQRTFRGSTSPLVCPADVVLEPRTSYSISLVTLPDDPFSLGVQEGHVSRRGPGNDARFRVAGKVTTLRDGHAVCEVANFTDEQAFLP